MQKTTNRKLFSNFISIGLVQGINSILPLLVMPFVITRIGADGFGVVVVAHVLMIYLSSVCDYGFNLTATRDISLYKEDKVNISKIFFTVLTSKLLITALLFLLLILALLTAVFGHNIQLYLFAFTYVVGQTLFVNWFFQGMEKMHFITIGTFISKLIFIILVLVFIRHKDDGYLFLFFFGIGNIVAGMFSICTALLVFKIKFLLPRSSDIITEIKGGWQITISNLCINTYLYSNVFILRIFTNDLTVGYYSVAEKIFFTARQVLSLFSQVIYPHICQLSHKSKGEVNMFMRQFYLPFLLMVIAGCSILFTFAPEIVHIFLKDASPIPLLVLRILSFVPVIVCLNIPAYQLLIAFNRKKSYLSILGLGTVINIAFNILLVNIWGATGTAVSIIITEMFITIGLNWKLNNNNLSGYVIPQPF